MLTRTLTLFEQKLNFCCEGGLSHELDRPAVLLRGNKTYCADCSALLDSRLLPVIRLSCDKSNHPTVFLDADGACYCVNHAKEVLGLEVFL